MASLENVRNTEYEAGDTRTFLVEEGVIIYHGALVVLNAAGYAEPGKVDTGLFCVGKADETVDNSLGEDGYASVAVHISNACRDFYWDNDTTDPVTQAHVGRSVYVFDDHTVSSDSSGTSVAGICTGFTPTGKVKVRHAL